MAPQSEHALPRQVDRLIGLLSKVFAQDGERHLQELLVNARVRVVEETDFDNWNGGQYGHDVHLSVSEDLLLPFIRSKDEVQTRIRTELNTLSPVSGEYVASVYLEIENDPNADWRAESGLLRAGAKRVNPVAEHRIWRPNEFRVFLSHKTEVKVETATLKERLGQFGVSSFVAHEDIHPTQDWQNEIELALATADAFVAILTDRFHDSLWTDQEVGYALARGIPIIALRLGKDPYGFIGRFQALTCDWKSAPLEVMKILIKHDRMVGAFIDAVRRCRSFDEANTLALVLPYLERLSSESAALLVSAYNENSEARGGFGLNGSNPRHYGPGMVSHLERLGIGGYAYGAGREIVKKQ